jgi:hypothetical protein
MTEEEMKKLVSQIVISSWETLGIEQFKRFPRDFMFELSHDEWNDLRYNFNTSSWGQNSRRHRKLNIFLLHSMIYKLFFYFYESLINEV